MTLLPRELDEVGFLLGLALLPREDAARASSAHASQRLQERHVRLVQIDEVRTNDEVLVRPRLRLALQLLALRRLGGGGGGGARRSLLVEDVPVNRLQPRRRR